MRSELPLPLSNVLNGCTRTGERDREPFKLEPPDDVPVNGFCDVEFTCDVRSLSLVRLLACPLIP